MKEINVHGYNVKDARNYVDEMLKVYFNKEDWVKIIHGYNSGDRLLKHFRNINNYDPKIVESVKEDISNSGATIVYLKHK